MTEAAPAVPPGFALSSRERIVAAARVQVQTKGILGLRVQDVAAEAKVSVPLIYKYFEDRDGLLAEVLGRMFEEVVLDNVDAAEQEFASLAEPTVEDFIKLVTLPQQEWRRNTRWMRVQILAASMEIPALRERLAAVQAHITERISDFLAQVQSRTVGEVRVPPRALALWLQGSGFGLVLNDLVDDDSAVNDAEYSQMLRAMFSSVFGTA